jgi:hypothetical protein
MDDRSPKGERGKSLSCKAGVDWWNILPANIYYSVCRYKFTGTPKPIKGKINGNTKIFKNTFLKKKLR